MKILKKYFFCGKVYSNVIKIKKLTNEGEKEEKKRWKQ